MTNASAQKSTSQSHYQDAEKWNQILYDQANKTHLHQDNLRWSLCAGFAVFFLTGMAAINNPQFKESHAIFHELQFALVVMGTIYFFVVMIEGWYYNLYLAHLIDCEQRMSRREDLTPISVFDRKNVRKLHPSFFFILMLIVVANVAHLWQASTEQWGIGVSWKCCVGYAMVFLPLTFRGHVPLWVDITLAKSRKI